jgi:hypothetical protein
MSEQHVDAQQDCNQSCTVFARCEPIARAFAAKRASFLFPKLQGLHLNRHFGRIDPAALHLALGFTCDVISFLWTKLAKQAP